MKLKKYLTTPTTGKSAVILQQIKDNDAKANETLQALNKQGQETMQGFQDTHVKLWNELKQTMLEDGLVNLQEKTHGDFSYNEFNQIFLDRLHIPQEGQQTGTNEQAGENTDAPVEGGSHLRPVPTTEQVTATH